MSIEIWQYPKAATRNELIAELKSMGFELGENIFWPGPEGTINLFWSDPKDYKSTSGVDASVFPISDEGKLAWNTSNDWAVRTRTSMWASVFDKNHQNNTVRSIRKRHGGSFYNDHHGNNRYIVIEKRTSTPASRGVHGVLERLKQELDSLEQALPEEIFKSVITSSSEVTDANNDSDLFTFVKQSDPSRVVYNALIPFLVAILENFFRETFEILLKYDDKHKRRLKNRIENSLTLRRPLLHEAN